MARVAGIAIKKNTRGEITHVIINVEKHRAIITPMLYELGVLEKTTFQQDCESAISLEQFRGKMHSRINKLWKK